MEEIRYLSKQTDFKNLIYHYKSKIFQKTFCILSSTRIFEKYKGRYVI